MSFNLVLRTSKIGEQLLYQIILSGEFENFKQKTAREEKYFFIGTIFQGEKDGYQTFFKLKIQV